MATKATNAEHPERAELRRRVLNYAAPTRGVNIAGLGQTYIRATPMPITSMYVDPDTKKPLPVDMGDAKKMVPTLRSIIVDPAGKPLLNAKEAAAFFAHAEPAALMRIMSVAGDLGTEAVAELDAEDDSAPGA